MDEAYDPEARLRELGLELPHAAPKGSYSAAVRTGDLLYVSGHGPLKDGKPAFQGRVPSEISMEEAGEAARLTVLNLLYSIRAELGNLDRVERFVKVFAIVLADPGFERHGEIMEPGSKLLMDVFGERGAHVRTTVGAYSLPFRIPIEVDLVLQVRE